LIFLERKFDDFSDPDGSYREGLLCPETPRLRAFRQASEQNRLRLPADTISSSLLQFWQAALSGRSLCSIIRFLSITSEVTALRRAELAFVQFPAPSPVSFFD
jgi:hypothetical protein